MNYKNNKSYSSRYFGNYIKKIKAKDFIEHKNFIEKDLFINQEKEIELLFLHNLYLMQKNLSDSEIIYYINSFDYISYYMETKKIYQKLLKKERPFNLSKNTIEQYKGLENNNN